MSYKINNVNFEGNEIPLCIKKNDNSDNIYTVLIGKNGSGKSRVLSAITNILCSVFVGNKLLKRNIGTVGQYSQDYHYSSLTIISDNNEYEVDVNGRSIGLSGYLYKEKLLCPQRLIAVSTSPFDKFPEESVYFSPENKSNNRFYHYYGLNDKAKSRAVLSLVEKLFFSINRDLLGRDKDTVVRLLSFLGFYPVFDLSFRLKREINKFMVNLREMIPDDFMDYIENMSKKSRIYLEKEYGVGYQELCSAFTSLYEYCAKVDSYRIIPFYMDFTKEVSEEDREFLSGIKILSDIGLLSIHDVVVHVQCENNQISQVSTEWYLWQGDNRSFSINDASSGQQCILLNFLGIAVSIENDSLILIDEPEISLHPEWQETYIHLLMEVFTHVKGCHFIIATHSPQIISNLKNNNCFVTLIESEELMLSHEYRNKSADFQLATLFKTPGIENEYLKRIAVNILSALSNRTFSYEVYSSDLNRLIINRDKIVDILPALKGEDSYSVQTEV
ncbi:AAA family ATPase [Limnobaculum xujianqingii]|uniref:AAA family ATPase n=1 Tax=Limnobaculum xujianqingii TaxID=2738837 RepID=UPI001129E157|nr:AAA family ATPase [Limnobaculum xujianqingii]